MSQNIRNYTQYIGSQKCCNIRAQSNQGAQGMVGPQGPVGYTGAQGPQGPSYGAQGSAGAQGSQGPRGYVGSEGSQGSTGFMGSTGSTGAQGVTGTTGSRGATGTQGATGAAGAANYPGANYRDLITFGFTQSNGSPGLTILKNTHTPVIIFSQPSTVSLAYISFCFANIELPPQTINYIQLWDMTDCTNYNFSFFSTSGPINGATLLATFCSATTVNANQNTITIIPNNITPVISPNVSPRAIGIVFNIAGNSTFFQLMSVVIGYQ